MASFSELGGVRSPAPPGKDSDDVAVKARACCALEGWVVRESILMEYSSCDKKIKMELSKRDVSLNREKSRDEKRKTRREEEEAQWGEERKGPQEEPKQGRNEGEREGATVVRTEEEGRSYLGDGQLNVSPYEVFARNLSEWQSRDSVGNETRKNHTEVFSQDKRDGDIMDERTATFFGVSFEMFLLRCFFWKMGLSICAIWKKERVVKRNLRLDFWWLGPWTKKPFFP